MAKVLLVVASQVEEEVVKSVLRTTKHAQQYEVLNTGIGMVATAYSLSKRLQQKNYELLINLGIAGSFNKGLSIGELVHVKRDGFSELGAEDGKNWIPFQTNSFNGNKNETNSIEWIQPQIETNFTFLRKLPKVDAITVSTVHGNLDSIKMVQERWPAQIESMEGAAVFFVGNQENLPCLQLRAISNYIETRDVTTWDIPMALKSLESGLKSIIKEQHGN